MSDEKKEMPLTKAQELAKASIAKLRGYDDPKAHEQAEMIRVLLETVEKREDNESILRQLADTEGLVKTLVVDVNDFAGKCAREEISNPGWSLKMDGSANPEEPDLEYLESAAQQAMDGLPSAAKE